MVIIHEAFLLRHVPCGCCRLRCATETQIQKVLFITPVCCVPLTEDIESRMQHVRLIDCMSEEVDLLAASSLTIHVLQGLTMMMRE